MPRSSYYRWKDTRASPTSLRRRELTDQVRTVFESSDGIYGQGMVHAKLATAGVDVSVGTVASIMAENGWQARRIWSSKI
ncbi:IS3 family transposase [Arthrobacter sp. GMC3]|uniref:IS3 family transposase n=1 Tax=Arthrobacter sp. GMC3 TaxID=2058894 RepID=UPI0015E39085